MVQKDELQRFVEKSEDPQWWRTITDELNNKEIRLSKADLEMLIRIRKGKHADKSLNLTSDEHRWETENPDMVHAFSNYEPKRRFVPSKWERLKVQKFLRAMKKGHMKTNDELKKEKEEKR
mmetsp:Transcript_30331/g.46396  ORF Transcript_30331/g.46396 Transcript_30331/m.46396 type:complete len:121 (+) Transcript_30331:478-840(+)